MSIKGRAHKWLADTGISIDTVRFLRLDAFCGACRVWKYSLLSTNELDMLPVLPLVLSRKPFHDFTPVAMAMKLCIFVFQSSALFNMRLQAQQARWRSRVRDQRAEENT